MKRSWTFALFATNVLVWGYNWVPLHLLLAHVGPATLAAARVAGGALALFLALLISRRPLTPPRSPMFIVVGLLQVSGMIALSTFALRYGDVSRTAILLFTMPFWFTLFSAVFFKEQVGARRWTALGIAIAGLGFIAMHASSNASALLGAALAVGAGACWAGGSVLAKHYLSKDDLLGSVMWQQGVGAVPLIVLALFVREPLSFPSAGTVALFLFTAVIGSGLGWLLWATVLSRVSSATASLGSLGIPLVAAIAAFLQLGERPDAVSLTGLGAILVAIVVSSWPNVQSQPVHHSEVAPGLLDRRHI